MRTKNYFRFLLIVNLLLFGYLYSQDTGKTADQLVAEAKKNIKELTVSEIKSMIDKNEPMFIIDVRELDEITSGKLKNSIHIPRGMIEFQINTKVADKNAKIIVYCKKDGRGALTAQTLQIMGYKNVFNMKGGIVAWEAAGYPIEK